MTSWGSIEKGIAQHDPAQDFRVAFRSASTVNLGAMHTLPVAEAGDVTAQSLPASGEENTHER